MTSESDDKTRPDCHGNLKKVFPLGDDGLRHTPPECRDCDHKTTCLRQALHRPSGLKVHEESLQRAYDAGTIGFLERWSRKKTLNQRQPKKSFAWKFWKGRKKNKASPDVDGDPTKE